MRTIPGDAHLECKHPKINDSDRVLSGFSMMMGLPTPAAKRLNVSGDVTGIKRGWFMWPINFDPTWLETCDGFEKKGGEQHESIVNQ